MPEQRVAAGAQTPVHEPLTHAWLVQLASSIQLPVPSQVCGVWPLHCLAPGEHVPEHAPPLHTLGQGASLCQVPVELHSCGVAPLH